MKKARMVLASVIVFAIVDMVLAFKINEKAFSKLTISATGTNCTTNTEDTKITLFPFAGSTTLDGMHALTGRVNAGTTAKGSFTTNLTGLDFNTVYYIRAFTTNSVGTGYGDVVKLNTTNDTSKVRFTYNGKEVVYGIIISSVTGKKWMDRNLGATQVATSSDDYKAYGDLFQWGRPADGHQLINWTSSTSGTPVNGTTTVLATSDTPGHSNYILPPYQAPWIVDWRNDNNRNRWATNRQGPCPVGWHVPTIDEWLAETSKIKGGTAKTGGMMNSNDAYRQLKLTIGGMRAIDGPGSASFGQVGLAGHYWSSSLDSDPGVKDFEFYTDGLSPYADFKSVAKCVRCLIN